MRTLTHPLNMSPGGIPPVIHVSQYDSDFTIVFTLFSTVGDFTIESGTTAMVRGTKSSGTGYSADATINISAKTVTVTGNQQMTAAAGQNVFEITLLKGAKEISSKNFILLCERAALDADTITDESVLKELNAIIEGAETATQAAEEAEDAADRAEAAAQSLVIDSVPTQGSSNAVSSGGVWSTAFIAERQVLQTGDNADNITTLGSYIKPVANNVSNLPVQNSGILIVMTRGTVVYQLYLSGAPNGGNLFYRKVGSAWKTLATADDVNSISSTLDNFFEAERQILQDGDDADTITLPGSYTKPASNTISNLPVQNSGYLIVVTRGSVIYQLYFSGSPNGGKLFYRRVGADWKTLTTTEDIEELNTTISNGYFKAFRSTFADGADANGATTAGAYAKPVSRTVANVPSQSSGYLIVFTNGNDARQLYITYNNLYYRINGRDWHMLTESRLFGKTLIALGDSLIYGQGLSADDRAKYTWTARLASDYGMTTYNYGVSGSSIAKLENGSGGEDAPLSMATRIDSIVTTHASDTVDYFILEGGANDFNNTPNFGELSRDNLDKTTFYGALNYIINQIHATWPKARLLLMTNYDRKIRGTATKNDETYVDAMVAFAKYRSIPVFDNYHTIGVSIKDYANPDYDPSTDPAENKYLDNWFFPKEFGQHLSIDAYEWVTPIYAQALERI